MLQTKSSDSDISDIQQLKRLQNIQGSNNSLVTYYIPANSDL